MYTFLKINPRVTDLHIFNSYIMHMVLTSSLKNQLIINVRVIFRLNSTPVLLLVVVL